MHQIHTYLEALWAFERVSASTILSIGQKREILNDIKNSLPDPILVVQAKDTYNIVLAKLLRSSISIQTKDEKPIGSKNNRPNDEVKLLPRGYNQSQNKHNSETPQK